VKAMFIKHNDKPLPTFNAGINTKMALAVCTLGIAIFGVCSYVYDWIYAAVAM
ncbi:MAG: NADH-quinone oxidoreductase subunit N, partial [Prevotellaceae bacterium]|nr:NADH-quinone oxidoreductase subunit N [Prevotellaceae bacterium]